MNRNIKNTFICSDLHLGSNSTAVRRGFLNAGEQDKCIIDNWKKRITKRDSVIIIGDVAFSTDAWIKFINLPGFKKVVLGNHDEPKYVKMLTENKVKIYGAMAARYNDIPIIITHIPVNPTTLNFRFRFNLHGHDHSNTDLGDKYLNFCIELIDFEPKKLDEIEKWNTN